MISTRYRNSKDTPGPGKQHCPWCCDQGMVMVGTEQTSSNFKGRHIVSATEMWGPCPNCEIGAAMEMAHWPRGFWQGRTIDIEKGCRCHDPSVSRAEIKAAMEEAKRAMRGFLPSPDPDARTRAPEAATRRREGLAIPAPPEPDHHRCPAYDGRNMPWPESKCEMCNPHPTEEITL